MDFFAYNVCHKGEMDWDVGRDEGRRVGGVREEVDELDEKDEWQDTDEDEDEDTIEDGSAAEETERPSTPPQQIRVESERVDSVMAGQLDREKGASTAWDEDASPKMRSGYISQWEDEFDLE
jgi:hypothetical protein